MTLGRRRTGGTVRTGRDRNGPWPYGRPRSSGARYDDAGANRQVAVVTPSRAVTAISRVPPVFWNTTLVPAAVGDCHGCDVPAGVLETATLFLDDSAATAFVRP